MKIILETACWYYVTFDGQRLQNSGRTLTSSS